MFDRGTGRVVVSRAISSGEFAVGVFMVDTFCLGVKDSFFHIMDMFEFEEMCERMRGLEVEVPTASPEYARKLIDDAVRYLEIGAKCGEPLASVLMCRKIKMRLEEGHQVLTEGLFIRSAYADSDLAARKKL